MPILNTLPVRAKVWANGWLLLLPLQGVGNGDMVPRALPWALDLLGFQPAQGRRQGFFRTISIYLIFLDFEHSTFQVGRSKLKYQRLAVAPSQRRFALARTIVCCGASIVAHFARKVRATNT